MKRIATLSALTAAFAMSGASAELTTNGGFEAGDTSGWTAFPTAAPSAFTAESTDPAAGAFNGQITNEAPASGFVVKQANVGVGQVNPGDELTVSFDMRFTGEAGGVANVEFFSELDGGGVSKSDLLLTQIDNLNEWTPFSYNVTAGPDVSGGVTLQFVATTGGAEGSLSNVEIDNVSIVPEPTSLALLGFGGLALMRRRRA